MASLFPGFEERTAKGDGADIFFVTGGFGPPLLLLHGFPQTHAMWHRVAPELARHFTLVIPDLRGYGRSSAPPTDPSNEPYSKRRMGKDFFAVMRALGHRSFAIVGHDRGARVGYRMALDEPSRVSRLAVLDIIPTYDMWHGMDRHMALKVYHWPFLAQPHPLPETLIGGSPVFYLDQKIASWAKSADLSVFDPEALAQYRLHYAAPDTIHASCNDYRAGATYDLEADEVDRAQGRKIACPTLALWGDAGIPNEAASPLDTWRQWCEDVRGASVDSGHFVAEENPQETLEHLLPFLKEAL